jgi:hypothetical protein
MAQVFTDDETTAQFAADPAPAPRTDYDLVPCSFGGDTFRNPCFWMLVGIAGTLAVQYIFTKRKE